MDKPEVYAARLMRPDDAAAYLKISTRQLRWLTNDGQIAYVNVGLGTEREARRYDKVDLDAFIQSAKTVVTPVTISRSANHRRDYQLVDFQALLDERQAEAKAQRLARGLKY